MANFPARTTGGNYVGADESADEDTGTEEYEEQHAGARYAEAGCDHCGVILPKNRLQRREVEQEVGRSSGATRRSTSSRNGSSNSFSGQRSTYRSSRGSTNSLSFSSGKTYYKNSVAFLCEDCVVAERKSRGSFVGWLFRFILLTFTSPTFEDAYRRWKR
jgi:hypothetical protein